MGDPDKYTLPDEKTLAAAGELEILNEAGNKVPFKMLYSKNDGKQRHLIVFIRHFFCGHCEDYTRTLSTLLTPEKLASTNTDLVIVGCGQLSVVPDYKQRTNCAFPIYCDPDRQLYRTLDMITNLDLGEKPQYINSGVVGGTLSSAWNIIRSGVKGFTAGGNYSQNGGEWFFDRGVLQWCHRMQNTRDHAEISEILSVLGLKEDGAGE